MKIVLSEATFKQVSDALSAAVTLALVTKQPTLHQQMLDAANALDDAANADPDETTK